MADTLLIAADTEASVVPTAIRGICSQLFHDGEPGKDCANRNSGETPSLSDRGGQCLGDCPSPFIEAFANHAVINTSTPSPRRDRQRLAIKRDHPVVAFICALFQLGGPAAILGRVRAVVVNAIDRMFRGWGWSHVR